MNCVKKVNKIPLVLMMMVEMCLSSMHLHAENVSTPAVGADYVLVAAHLQVDSIGGQPQEAQQRRVVHIHHSVARLCFPVNRTEVRPDYMDNRAELHHIVRVIDSIQQSPDCKIHSITLRAYASPEASVAYNKKLAMGRMESFAAYLETICKVQDVEITSDYQPEDWDGLRMYVEKSTVLAHRDEILQIIDGEADLDEKEALIRSRYPHDYRHLLLNCYPMLRRTDVDIEYSVTETYVQPVPVPQPEPDTIPVTPQPSVPVIPFSAQEPVESPVPDCHEGLRPKLAVKTNLIYYMALAPNLEIERWWGRHAQWSVMAEWQAPWYVWHHNSRAYEVLNGGLEVRRWLHGADPCHRWLTGCFLGAYFMGGKYDLEWNHKGYQGEYYSAGLTVGFAHRLARRWNMEYSVSGGYLATDYRRYHGMFNDQHLIWQHNGQADYAGPTKVKVSLVYLW